jgi:O-antigen/teichoic acid export membrane protein
LKLLTNSAIYSGLGILDKGIGLLLLPIYTRFLTPADYGTFTVVDSITTFLVLLYPVGADATLIRTQFTEKDPDRLARLRGTLMLFLLCMGLIGGVVLSLGREWLLQPFGGDVAFWPFLVLGLISAWFQPVQRAYLSILQARQNAMGFIRQAGGASILRIGLVLLFVVVLRWGAVGLMLGIIIPYVVFAIVALWQIRRDVVWCIDWSALQRSLVYSLPIVPHLLAGWTTGYLGMLVLNHFEGTADVGIYGIAAKFALIVGFVTHGISVALQPQMYAFYANPTEKEAPVARVKVLGTMAIFGIVAVGVALFSADVIRVMATPVFYTATSIVPILALATFLQGVYSTYANALYFEEKGPRFLPIASIAGAIVSVVLMFWLIPMFAAYGTALATLAGVGSRMVLAVILANAKAGIFWSQIRMAIIVTATGVLCAVAWLTIRAEWPLFLRVSVWLCCLPLFLVTGPWPLMRDIANHNISKAKLLLRIH